MEATAGFIMGYDRGPGTQTAANHSLGRSGVWGEGCFFFFCALSAVVDKLINSGFYSGTVTGLSKLIAGSTSAIFTNEFFVLHIVV